MSRSELVGVGSTDELSLRMSVASLVRVVFTDPDSGASMLALERKATFLPVAGHVTVKTQPFGGALRIHDLLPLYEHIGDFHFDSQHSRSEGDFRIYIRPSAWGAARDFCLEQFQSPNVTTLESGPAREMAEEFSDALGINLSQGQYECDFLWTVLENYPAPTGNVRAVSQPTVRVYRAFEAHITDPALVEEMIANSQSISNHDLQNLVMEDFHRGGKGRANAFLVLPMGYIRWFTVSLRGSEISCIPLMLPIFMLKPSCK